MNAGCLAVCDTGGSGRVDGVVADCGGAEAVYWEGRGGRVGADC